MRIAVGALANNRDGARILDEYRSSFAGGSRLCPFLVVWSVHGIALDMPSHSIVG